ncbi:MAG: class I SAM-dependent methyltransferase [Candidatus Oleimicrobiaceae bacterium]
MATLRERLLLGECESLFFTELSHVFQGHETVLDVGAGTGRFSLAIAQRVTTGKVLCLDVSAHSLRAPVQRAGKRGLEDKIHPLRGEASFSGLRGDAVDLVVSNNVLHELPQPEVVLREMAQVLKPEGWLLVSDFRDTHLTRLLCRSHEKGAHGPWRVDELETPFATAGLLPTRVYPVRSYLVGVGQK